MLTDEEKRELIRKSINSFEEVRAASRRAAIACQRAITTNELFVELMPRFKNEIGRSNLTVGEVSDYLALNGRELELGEFLRIAEAAWEAGQDADEASGRAELAYARAETFSADLLAHGILDKSDPEVAACLNGVESLRDSGERRVGSDLNLWMKALPRERCAAVPCPRLR